MNVENREVAERLVKAAQWRWMGGMLPLQEGFDGEVRTCERAERHPDGRIIVEDNAWPDLSDPATAGCLLAMVRAVVATQSITFSVGLDLEERRVVARVGIGDELLAEGDSQGAALAQVLALLWGAP